MGREQNGVICYTSQFQAVTAWWRHLVLITSEKKANEAEGHTEAVCKMKMIDKRFRTERDSNTSQTNN